MSEQRVNWGRIGDTDHIPAEVPHRMTRQELLEAIEREQMADLQFERDRAKAEEAGVYLTDDNDGDYEGEE